MLAVAHRRSEKTLPVALVVPEESGSRVAPVRPVPREETPARLDCRSLSLLVYARRTGRSRSCGITEMMKAGEPRDKASGMGVTLPLNGIIARVALADQKHKSPGNGTGLRR